MDTRRLYRRQVAIFACLYLGYAIYVLNRKMFSYVIPVVMKDLDLSKGDLGLISSSQTLAYAIAKFALGVLSDKFSSRVLFIMGLVLTGLVTLITSCVSSVPSFSFMMFLLGTTSGCGWPACAKILKKWYSPSQFGSVWGFLSSSMNLTGAVGPMLATYLSLHYSWQTSLQVAGVVSLVYAGLCGLVLHDSPSSIGFEEFVTKDEKKTSNDDSESKHETTSVVDLLRSPYLWTLFFAYMLVFATKTCLQDWAQLYLIQEQGRSVLLGSSFVSSFESGGLVGSFLAGFWSDRMLRVFSRPSQARTSVILVNLSLASIFIYLLIFRVTEDSSEVWITSLGFVLGVCVFGSTCLYGVLAVENAPSHLSGSANAFVALGANVGGMVAGLPLSLLAKLHGWRGALLCINICCLAACVLHFVTFPAGTGVSINEERTSQKKVN